MSQKSATLFYRQNTLPLFEENGLIDHVEIAEEFSTQSNGKNLATKNSGKFYTPEMIALPLIQQLVTVIKSSNKKGKIRIIDPFCGDGRLIKWTIPYLRDLENDFEIHIWDYDGDALAKASAQINDLGKQVGITFTLHPKKIDSFAEFFKGWESSFDMVITNPPWEVVKPDPKDIACLDEQKKKQYIASLKEFSNRLLRDFSLSRPAKSYGGWGVNLARVGTELSIRLAKPESVVGIVAPSTIFADQNSYELRKWMFENNDIKAVNVYPAELKLFLGVDQPSVSFALVREGEQDHLEISDYRIPLKPASHKIKDVQSLLESMGYTFPISIAANPNHLQILSTFSNLPRFSDLESNQGIWMGRELDETNHKSWLHYQGKHRFIKGRDIDRYNVTATSEVFVNEQVYLPKSIQYQRIVWRDVSRPTQKRRIIATIIPPGYVTGNSLGALYVKGPQNSERLLALLGLVSSFVFEFQLRAHLATAHISAGVMKKVRIPDWHSPLIKKVSKLVEDRMNSVDTAEYELEVIIAKAYGLSQEQFGEVLNAFPKIDSSEKSLLLSYKLWKQE